MSDLVRLFGGSYLDGCEVNLLDWCGLELTDEEEDRLDIETTDLLEEAGAYVEIDREIDDAPPGMNDTYYSVYCSDEESFKRNLKAKIIELISGQFDPREDLC